MENQSGDNRPEEKNTGLRAFAVKRIVIAAILIIAVVWVFGLSLGKLDRSSENAGRTGPWAGEPVRAHHRELRGYR